MKILVALFVFVIGSCLFGCSTARCPVTTKRAGPLPLYVYFGSNDGQSANRFLSTKIHFGEEIYVGGDDFIDLKGRIEQHGASVTADLIGGTGQQSQFYRGTITLEKPFFAQGGAASGGAGPPFWFLISTNSDCRLVLDRVNAVQGLTGQPFSHLVAAPHVPAPAAVPRPLDPNTGLPSGKPLIDPTTGLPVPIKPDKQN
jgi:hypothetical protein